MIYPIYRGEEGCGRKKAAHHRYLKKEMLELNYAMLG